MNGKKAKRLRRLATIICQQEKVPLGKGYNEYNQAMNRISWEPTKDGDGNIARDPETGDPLIKPGKAPGTITTAWQWRTLYKKLKRQFSNGRRTDFITQPERN